LTEILSKVNAEKGRRILIGKDEIINRER